MWGMEFSIPSKLVSTTFHWWMNPCITSCPKESTVCGCMWVASIIPIVQNDNKMDMTLKGFLFLCSCSCSPACSRLIIVGICNASPPLLSWAIEGNVGSTAPLLGNDEDAGGSLGSEAPLEGNDKSDSITSPADSSVWPWSQVFDKTQNSLVVFSDECNKKSTQLGEEFHTSIGGPLWNHHQTQRETEG